MRILYLITKPERGGAQTHVRDLILGLAEHDITLGTGRPGWLTKEITVPTVIFKHLNRSLNPLTAVFYIFELRQFLKQNHFDLLHFHSSNSLIGVLATLGLKSKPKTIATLHGLSLLHPGWQKLKLIKMLYRQVMKFLLKFFDKIIFVCQADQKFALHTQLVKPEQAQMIYNGLNPNIYFLSRATARIQLGLPTDLFIIGTVARFEYSKHLKLMIQTADKLRNHHLLFVILGQGPEQKYLSQLIERQQLVGHVMLINCFPDPKTLIKAFDAFLITSRYEGLPYTLLEAGLAELPIIATDVGGINEVLDQTHPADPDYLARQILMLKQYTSSLRAGEAISLDSRLPRPAQGKACHDATTETKIIRDKIITQFSQEKMIKKIITLYDQTLA